MATPRTDYSMLWNIEGFDFNPTTPLYDGKTTILVSLVYLVVVFAFHQYMKNRKPMKLRLISSIHNLFLCIASIVMCSGIIYGAYLRGKFTNLKLAYCDNPPIRPFGGVMGYWCYIYFLSKFYELLDTILMIAKKKPLSFLHVWHHGVIGPLSWSWMFGEFTPMWYGALINSTIHVFMYYYFFVTSAFNYSPWWKKYLTSAQILQFLSVFININLYTCFYLRSWPTLDWDTPNDDLPGMFNLNFLPSIVFERGCYGKPWVVLMSQGINVSFFFLFVNFYINSYVNNRRSKGPKSGKSNDTSKKTPAPKAGKPESNGDGRPKKDTRRNSKKRD